MLSMFKDKKGFSVLFRNAETAAASPPAEDVGASVRRSSRLSGLVSRYAGGSGVAQLQCQRCSKRFSAVQGEEGGDSETQSCCRRCGYPTCPQCRECVVGNPAWVCCVCDGPKSFMWLLEKTKMGPRLVSKIVEFCDPRGQRLMRSMFCFTLQQYRAVSSPRPSLTIAASGRVSGSRAGSGNSQTPPTGATTATSKSRTAARTSGERGVGSTSLSALSASHGNTRRPSLYSHPKHASLLRLTGRLPAMEGKENSPVLGEGVHVSGSPKRPHGSEALRRDDAAGVVEYSPEPIRQVVREPEADAEHLSPAHWYNDDRNNAAAVGDLQTPSPLPQQQQQQQAWCPRAEDHCTAVQDIYRAGETTVTPRSTVASGPKAEEVSASPHVRPSGHAAFQREALRQLPPNANDNSNNNAVSARDPVTPVARETETVTLQLDATAMSITPPGQPCRLGRSFSRASSGSGRSESPAPRFPTFAQFLDDQAAVAAGQTQLPRESDVLVTVSPDSSEGRNIMELGGGTRASRPTAKSSKGGFCTPRGTQPGTPPSAGASSSRRNERRTSGLSGDLTPTRALDLSDARGTVRHGSSSRRRTTRGSLVDMHAPHLYSSGGGTGRRSGQLGDSPFMYDLPSQFCNGPSGAMGGGARVASARGQIRRQHAPLATRTAGRTLGGGGAATAAAANDARLRLARQSRTTTPLQRTASRSGALQRIQSGSRVLARTNSATSQFARKNSSTVHGGGGGFGRVNSGTAQLTRTPSSRTRLAGVPLSPNGQVGQEQRQPLQRAESSKLVRTASSGLPQPSQRAAVPAALERTHSHYGLSARASPLRRTASHGGLGGPAPFCRFHSTTAFARSATATAGFARTHSASVFHGGTAAASHASPFKHDDAAHRPHGVSSSAFVRTTTGTYLSTGAYGGGRAAVTHSRAAAFTSRLLGPAKVSYARKKMPGSRTGAASPLQRTNTATRRAVAGARPPTPTGFTRTLTNPSHYERQPSHPLRKPTPTQASSSSSAAAAAGAARAGVARTRVDPAPALVGVARRKASAASTRLRRTPSALSRADSATAATPRTPRPYVITSVSTAATPATAAAAHGLGGGGGARPVLSFDASSTKTRSTRDSLTSGSVGTPRTSGGGGCRVSMTPVERAPTGAALAGRTNVPRRHAGAAAGAAAAATTRAATGSRAGVFTRSGTGTLTGAATRDARTRTGPARPSSGFVRLNSRPAM